MFNRFKEKTQPILQGKRLNPCLTSTAPCSCARCDCGRKAVKLYRTPWKTYMEPTDCMKLRSFGRINIFLILFCDFYVCSQEGKIKTR